MRPRPLAGLKAFATLLFVPMLATAQLPRRDTAPRMPAGDSTITGRVMTTEGRPLARARVMLRAADSAANAATVEMGRTGNWVTGPHFWQQVTDATGQFTFANIPAGSYQLSAVHPRYLAAQYGQRFIGQPGRPIELAAGQQLRADLVAVRGGAVTGRVFDEHGEPMPDVSVMAYAYAVDGSQKRLVPAGGRSYGSNDIGQYRIANLPPGEYVIAAQYRGAGDPASAGQAVRQGYAATYYPGTPLPSAAQAVRVAPGSDAEGVDFVLQPTHMVQVSGVILGSSGQPAPGTQLRVTPVDGSFAGASRPSTRVMQDGTFLVSDLTPGEYIFSAQHSVAARNRRAAETSGSAPRNAYRDMEYGTLHVNVGGVPLENLTIQMSPGARVTVTIQSDLPLPRGMIGLVAEQPPAVSQTLLGDGNTFVFNTGPGRYRLQLQSLPAGWAVERIMRGPRDITADGLVIRDNSSIDIVMHVTSRGAVITGTAAAGAAAAPSDYTVVVLPEHVAERASAAQRVRLARSSQNGRFVVQGLRAGTYYVAALAFVDPDSLYDAAFWASVEPHAIRVTVRAGETQHVAAPFISRR